MSWISLLYQSIVLNSSLIRFENQIWSTEILTSLPFYRQPETHNSENSDDTSIRSLISNYTLIQFCFYDGQCSEEKKEVSLVLVDVVLVYNIQTRCYKLTCQLKYVVICRTLDLTIRNEARRGWVTQRTQSNLNTFQRCCWHALASSQNYVFSYSILGSGKLLASGNMLRRAVRQRRVQFQRKTVGVFNLCSLFGGGASLFQKYGRRDKG
ncbi:Hypothetical_protein [Hexamita inflata]|uniref:Hypothetical_protein n=1 Tax=Hexamita inflata TaxID=28002 RepID=A0AA86V024_9EUKA|nr:Hypothetical protein HINF_LOCUS62864 [Hexamita inflata]